MIYHQEAISWDEQEKRNRDLEIKDNMIDICKMHIILQDLASYDIEILNFWYEFEEGLTYEEVIFNASDSIIFDYMVEKYNNAINYFTKDMNHEKQLIMRDVMEINRQTGKEIYNQLKQDMVARLSKKFKFNFISE